MAKVIITCAVTGSAHTPSMSPHLPITPDAIAAAAIKAAAAGAGIIHFHARDPDTGRPTQDPEIYRRFLPEVADACDVVINITTGGGFGMTLDERLTPAMRFQPEIASLNMGSFNLGFFGMLNRFKDFRFAWEREFLENRDIVFKNSYADIEHILRSCGETGIRFEMECYDVSHLYTAAHFRDAGLVRGPLFIQTVFGLNAGIGVHYEDFITMKRTADRLFGDDYVWSVLGAGKHQIPLVTMGAAIGGHVRVGMEDSLWDGPGKPAASNADQVRRIRTIVEALGLEVATPDDVRAILHLKGRGGTLMS